jgi:hypothetical protein
MSVLKNNADKFYHISTKMLGWSDEVAIILRGKGRGLLQKECGKDCSFVTEVRNE